MSLTNKHGRPLLPESLSEDFSSSQERTRDTVRALYSVLIQQVDSPSLRPTFEQWGQLFSMATEYEQQKAKPARNAVLQKAFERLGLTDENPDLGRFVFATHTFFAILAKLLALNAAAAQPSLNEWSALAKDDLAQRFLELESGSLFRTAGLGSFLEGDFFGWYVRYLTPELLEGLRAVVARLAEYDFSPFGSATGQTRDLVKAIYLRLVPPAVRKALGEYYTPDWLAGRLLNLLQDGRFRGDPDTRVLDPSCGSGTFLVLAINAVQNNPRAHSMTPRELLRKICQNIVGIDLNPLAVIAARANYLLALGPLLRHRGGEGLEIPVYLADSIRLPSLENRRLTAASGSSISPSPPSDGGEGWNTFDYVVGNPPWIGWENLPEDYRAATKELWHEHGLFVHRGMDTILGKGKKDLSMLMTYVAAEHYLKEGGKLGFVITQAVFTMAGAGQGFRRFLTRSNSPLHCERVEDYSSLPVFDGANTRAAVFVLKKGEKQIYPTPYFLFRPGLRPSPGAATLDEWEAEPSDPYDPTSPWLTASPTVLQAVKKVLGRSDYKAHQGVNTGGANAVYWFEIVKDDGGDGVIARNIVGAAKRKIKSESIPLEKCRLFPLLRGRDVRTWRAHPSAWLLFVQDVQTRRGLAEAEMARTPDTLQWLHQNKRLLLQRAAYKRFFKPETAPYWSMFDVGCYTLKPWKVVWPRIARQLDAAVVSSFEGKPILAQETFSCISLDDETEAFYVAGVLNSTPFRFAVRAFSQPGSKSFGTPSILERARIPRFDPACPLHQSISNEAKRLPSGAPDAAAAAHSGLDALCRPLWNLTENELQSIQQSYREAHDGTLS